MKHLLQEKRPTWMKEAPRGETKIVLLDIHHSMLQLDSILFGLLFSVLYSRPTLVEKRLFVTFWSIIENP